MIEAYWSQMFGRYERSKGEFVIDSLPEPLMSAHYGVRNLVGVETKGILNMKICSFSPLENLVEEDEEEVKKETLEKALKSESFKNFHANLGVKGLPFLLRLGDFLIAEKLEHYHYFIADSDGLQASVLVGISAQSVFLFNMLVNPSQRKRGLSNRLFRQIRSDFLDRPCFFWTLHNFLGQGATKVTPYTLKY